MKRNTTLVAVLIGACAIACFGPSGERPARGGEDKPEEKVKTIPLKSIYSTSRQEGLKRMDQGQGDKGFENQMQELYQQSIKMGASNVFLARGDDIAAAVKATWEVFVHGQRVNEPAGREWRNKSNQYWLVAYLETSGSEPPAWLLKSADVSGQGIRLTFANPGSSANDLHPYFYWAPLGTLKPGTYDVQLVDGDQQQVTLLRRVKVAAK